MRGETCRQTARSWNTTRARASSPGAWRKGTKLLLNAASTDRAERKVRVRMASSTTSRWQLRESEDDVGELGSEDDGAKYIKYHRKDLAVVLVNPQIPQNVGTIARSCAASRVGLHIVKPMAFDIDDTKLKRAGLDYWKSVFVKLHESWETFLQYYDAYHNDNVSTATTITGTDTTSTPSSATVPKDSESMPMKKRMLAYSKRGVRLYTQPETVYNEGETTFLLFGSETNGLSDEMLDDIEERCGRQSLVRIPICEDHVRSLNLSVCVGISIWDAIRQLDYAQDNEKSVLHRDMYDRTRIIDATKGV